MKTLGEQMLEACGWWIAHLVHLSLLLVPTLVLAGFAGVGWATVLFAGGITAAGALESFFVPNHFRVNQVTVHDSLAMRVALFVGLCLLTVFWSAQIEHLAHRRSSAAMHVMGACLLATGVALRIGAIRALGPQFVSDIQVDETLVRDGIYAWLSHPSEIGLLLIAAGGPLLIAAPLTAIAATVVLAPVSLWRIRRENTALSAWRRSRSAATESRSYSFPSMVAARQER